MKLVNTSLEALAQHDYDAFGQGGILAAVLLRSSQGTTTANLAAQEESPREYYS